MPLSAIPQQDFMNREAELDRLGRLGGSADLSFERSVLLVGPRGIGKSELMKQLYHRLFWEEAGAVPFYFRFRSATLKARHFSRDYFSRFIRQFVACLAKDLALIDNMSVPIHRLASRAPHQHYASISELVEDFEAQAGGDDLTGRLLAAISAPLALAGSTGMRFVVMLDDFHLAAQVYESEPGDTPGVVSVFEQSMTSHRAAHVITGSPEDALYRIFADDSLRGKAERLRIGPLPSDAASRLFGETCGKMGAREVSADCGGLLKHLGGNPLYIVNLARAVGRAGMGEVTAEEFMECYAREVTEGETAAYWSSIMGRGLGGPRQSALAAEVIVRLLESPKAVPERSMLARQYGVSEKTAEAVIEALDASGMLPEPGAAVRDTVVEDFVRGVHMRAAGADGPQAVHDAVRRRRFGGPDAEPVNFEMVIPNASDTELVAARAVEQICSGTGLGEEDARQLSMAIIEACINAMEHGGGHDDRVFLKCAVYPGRIEVAVESQGRPIDPASFLRKTGEMPGLDQRRGRGFSLMNRFVDDVRVERIRDRTRVVLVKEIKDVKENR